MPDVHFVMDGNGKIVQPFRDRVTADRLANSRAGHSVQTMTIADCIIQCDAVQETKNGALTARVHCRLPAGHDTPVEHYFEAVWPPARTLAGS